MGELREAFWLAGLIKTSSYRASPSVETQTLSQHLQAAVPGDGPLKACLSREATGPDWDFQVSRAPTRVSQFGKTWTSFRRNEQWHVPNAENTIRPN